MKDLISTLDKKTIILTTLGFFCISALFIYIALHNTADPKELASESRVIENIMDECELAANRLDFNDVIVVKGKKRRTVSIKQKTVEDPMDLIYRTTILKSECKKFTMVEYCMGEDCKKSSNDSETQFRILLKLNDDK